MTDLVVQALKEAGRPMQLAELARAVEARGYRHSVKPKHPRQLRASISALPHKSRLIRRVGLGEYALSSDGPTSDGG
jgi:hypothetical protein